VIIKDNQDKLLAIILKPSEIKDQKFFATDHDTELQLASFQLDVGEEIIRHYHPKQERSISLTSEVIIVTEGKIEVEIYDNNLELNSIHEIKNNEIIALFNGGHQIRMLEKSKFIEVKQGPYNPETDKKHF